MSNVLVNRYIIGTSTHLPLSRCLDISPSNVSFSFYSADLSREWSGVCFNHYLMEKATFQSTSVWTKHYMPFEIPRGFKLNLSIKLETIICEAFSTVIWIQKPIKFIPKPCQFSYHLCNFFISSQRFPLQPELFPCSFGSLKFIHPNLMAK